jgi:hypothetical protein
MGQILMAKMAKNLRRTSKAKIIRKWTLPLLQSIFNREVLATQERGVAITREVGQGATIQEIIKATRITITWGKITWEQLG